GNGVRRYKPLARPRGDAGRVASGGPLVLGGTLGGRTVGGAARWPPRPRGSGIGARRPGGRSAASGNEGADPREPAGRPLRGDGRRDERAGARSGGCGSDPGTFGIRPSLVGCTPRPGRNPCPREVDRL